MSIPSAPPPPTAPSWRRLLGALSLRDGRRPEEQHPGEWLGDPARRPLVDLLVIGGAVVALTAGALFVSAGGGSGAGGRTAQLERPPPTAPAR